MAAVMVPDTQIYYTALNVLRQYFTDLYTSYALNVFSPHRCIKVSLKQYVDDVVQAIIQSTRYTLNGKLYDTLWKKTWYVVVLSVVPSLQQHDGFTIRKLHSHRVKYIICTNNVNSLIDNLVEVI